MLRAAHDLGRARRPGRAGRGGGPRADVGLRAGRPRATALPAGPADLAGALRRAGGGHRRARRVRLRGRGPPVDAGHEGRTAGMRWARERGAVIGIEFTTFSLIGRCERTGMFGIAIATNEMAVGSRCIHVAPGVGAVVTQASTNPRLGHLGLNLLPAGYSAPRVLEEIAASDQFVERRQPYATVDLRVDLHPTPVAELRRLADAYFPLVPYYNLRPRDPSVPSAAEWLAAQRQRAR